MKQPKIAKRLLCLSLTSLLALSLVACNSPTDEQNSAQPTSSTQPTAAPTPTPTPPPIPYTDVAEDSPYYDAVVWAYENGIASDGETFGPADTCTRGQVMTFLWRAKGSPEPQTAESLFSDVSSVDWFYKPVLWAWENGIVTGSAFNPGNSCTNAEVLTFLWRAEGKPIAAIGNSSIALAASGTYYAKPAAWADNNGMFTGLDSAFDPAAPCTRADLMTYLYWATEEWTFAEEDKTVQAEYEQIINDAQLYEVYGSGLCYADYVDIEGDGTVELLTIGFGEDITKANVTVYANIDGHAGKYCEGTVENFFWKENDFSICRTNGKIYLHTHGKVYLQTWGGNIEGAEEHQFFKIEKGNFALEDGFSIGINGVADEVFDYVSQKAITANECKAILQKYTDEEGPFTCCYVYTGQIAILDRGLLPDPSAVMQKIYAAVKNGDFSAFAGNYSNSSGSYTLNRDGVLAGNYVTSNKPVSVRVDGDGSIFCGTQKKMVEEDVIDFEGYYIYPVGVSVDVGFFTYMDGLIGVEDDPSKVRIVYTWPGATQGIFMTQIS